MADFKDLNELVGDITLPLPIGGKIYQIPDADGETFLWAQAQVRIMQAAVTAPPGEEVPGAQLDDDEEIDFFDRILSAPIYAEMLADGIGATKLKRIAATVLMWIVADEDTALIVWESGDSPEAAAAALKAKGTPGNRASRRASAAAARTTPTPKRGSGSKVSTSTPRKRPATRGTKSSSSGD